MSIIFVFYKIVNKFIDLTPMNLNLKQRMNLNHKMIGFFGAEAQMKRYGMK